MLERQSLIGNFTARLTVVVDAEALARGRDTILEAFGGGTQAAPRRRGRPPQHSPRPPSPSQP